MGSPRSTTWLTRYSESWNRTDLLAAEQELAAAKTEYGTLASALARSLPSPVPRRIVAASTEERMLEGAQGGSGRGERVLLFAIASMLIGLLLFHFACTLLYLTPPNPIRIALHQPLERYMHPYFFQSWRLFAPDPGGKDGVVLVACRRRGGDTPQETALFDITSPLLEHRYRHRLSPGLLLVRAQKPRLFPVANPMNEAIRRYGLPSPVIEAARAELEAAAKRRFEVGKTHLYRIASAACDRRLGPARTTEVKARYVSRKVPPFGARDSVPFLEETNTYDFPWAPHEVVDGY